MILYPYGDSALEIRWAEVITPQANDQVWIYWHQIKDWSGVINAIPGYVTLTIQYDDSQYSFESMREMILALELGDQVFQTNKRHHDIGVRFDDEVAIDKDAVCTYARLNFEEVMDLFCANSYKVYMMGFLPGFGYLGDVDERIAVPRHKTPRLQVPARSIAIADRQAAIYPVASPGGWHIIGQTEVELFSSEGLLLSPGDTVKFYQL
jgi:inhibitor of KinA